jgi:hypothetical protein
VAPDLVPVAVVCASRRATGSGLHGRVSAGRRAHPSLTPTIHSPMSFGDPRLDLTSLYLDAWDRPHRFGRQNITSLRRPEYDDPSQEPSSNEIDDVLHGAEVCR